MTQIPTNLAKCRLIILSHDQKAAKPNYLIAKCFTNGTMNIRATIKQFVNAKLILQIIIF